MRALAELVFDNTWRRLPETLWADVAPRGLRDPKLVDFNPEVAQLLDLDPAVADTTGFLAIASGNGRLPGMQPLAQKYTGHQFGVYNPQLGDGRGLLLGEIRNKRGDKFDLHLKGAGTTPWSRGADGRAVLRSTIREYLCSAAMQGLGIPSTRALAITTGSDVVWREEAERCAMLIRVSASHLRFGHFEYLFHSRQHEALAQLADYAIEHHFPEHAGKPDRHARLLRDIVARTARLIAHWQAVGFNHGVMNTDNMSILGETFDYGPFAFFDEYDARLVCNHSDEAGRYAFHRQPAIGLWNLNALAHAFSALVPREELVEALQRYQRIQNTHFMEIMRAKLGIRTMEPGDDVLLQDLLDLLQENALDYTVFFRKLCDFRIDGLNTGLRNDVIDRARFDAWARRYAARLRCEKSIDEERAARMRRSNPKFILRNWVAQVAIEKAAAGDYSEVALLRQVLQSPCEEWPELEHLAQPPPDWGRRMPISCSS
ncbi:MAG: protein adenylyltransferase SelO [Gammaproteobacteria bacterium]